MSTAAPKRILVVDDKPDAAQALQFTIEDAGYEVVTAEGIDDAMAKASEATFDATVLDLSMNDLGRLEVSKKLEADALTALPIVLLTELKEENVRKQFTGYDQFVSRKEDLDELLRQLAKITSKSSVVHDERQTTFS